MKCDNLLTIENCGIWGYRESNVRVLDPDCHAAQPGCTLGQQALSGGDIRSVTRNSRVGWKTAIPGLFQTQAPTRQRCLEVRNKKMRSNSLDHDRGRVPDAVGSGIAPRWCFPCQHWQLVTIDLPQIPTVCLVNRSLPPFNNQ
jgi:hypothetical protein